MKKIKQLAAIFISALFISGNASAAMSTINPNVPTANSQLSSAVIRNNFVAAYNDINALYALATGGTTLPNVTTTLGSVARSISDHFADVANAADFGVVCDGTALVDGSITQNTATFSSPSYNFTAADVGKVFDLEDTNLTVFEHTSIASVSGNNAVLAANWTNYAAPGTARATFYKTDNTAAIARANTSLQVLSALGFNTKGYKLNFANGVCATHQATLYRFERYGCTGGPGACRLYNIVGTNAPFIITENEPALTGTGLNYGPTGTFNGRTSDPRVPSHFGLEDIQLDCNGLGQTKGTCFSSYGNSLLIKGVVEMFNSHDDCVFTEMTDAPAWSLSDPFSFEEGHIDVLKTHTCGGWGWTDEGPKDMGLHIYIDAESKLGGLHNKISAGYYAGTFDSADQIHGYTETSGVSMLFEAPANTGMLYTDYAMMEINTNAFSTQHVNTTACGFRGVASCVQIDAGGLGASIASGDIEFYPGITNTIGLNVIGQQTKISNVTVSDLTPGANVIGIKVGGSFNHLTNMQPHNLNQTGDICIDVAGSNNNIEATGYGCTTFLDANTAGYGDGGANHIRFSMYGATGQAFVGAYPFAKSDYLELTETNGSTGVTSYFTQTPNSRSQNGTQEYTGTVPTVATGSSDCGTSAAVVGNSIIGKVTVGTGTNGGKCTVSFGGGAAWANPICIVQNQTSTARPVSSTDSSSGIVISGSLTAGDVLKYQCSGWF